MTSAPPRHLRAIGAFRTIGATVLVTSLGWIAAFALWLMAGEPGRAPVAGYFPRAASAPAPALMPVPHAAAGQGLLIPVAGVGRGQLVDTFSQARAAGARVHDAIDIPAPRGTPVIAAAPGRVEKLFLSRDGGNTVYLRSPDGRRIYYYAHLDSYVPDLAEGAEVRAGDRLGAVGSTGNASPEGPHLHFAVLETNPASPWYEPALAINPYPLLAGPAAR